MSQYDDLLGQLAIQRKCREEEKVHMDGMIDDCQKDPEFVQSSLKHSEATHAIADLEEKIKMLAHTEWMNTKNKNPHPFVAVKIFKTFKVVNADTVREWVLKNLPAALDPNLKKIEKYVMEIGPVDGTEKGEEARVQIASKL